MLLFLLYLIPILAAGVLILRKISSLNRLELLLPAGSILGLALFTFLLNLTAFFIKDGIGILISYLVALLAGFIFLRSKNKKIYLPEGKGLFFWPAGIFIWGAFIYWKAAHALTGSDVNLYYAIAHSFAKGNFPLLTPWQPDISLSYHVGVSELLGAFYYFSGLDFQFLHLFFSAFFIFCSVQIIIWIIKAKHTLISFLFANLGAAVIFISFGFFYISWPSFPLQFPSVSSIQQLVLWLRDLPSVNQAIEVYGAPINLDALIYFIFQAFGLSIFFSLMVLILHYDKRKPLTGWIMLCVGLATVALVNESLFAAAFPALAGGIFLIEWGRKTLFKNLKILLLLLISTILVVLLQGGMISSFLNSPQNLQNSTIIFPKKEDIKEDFNSYHAGQMISKLLPVQLEWLPLRWFHVGIDSLLILSLIAMFAIRSTPYQLLLIKILFIAGFSSLIAYNVIVPKFLVANGNRLLAASFLFFSLLLSLSLIFFFENIRLKGIKKILLLILVGWILIPTILPPLTLLSKTRFGENKLTPKTLQSSQGILWFKDNINFNERVIVLDKNAPHPSGQVRALVEAGVFAPVFPGDFRAFTIEASPQYIDIAYYLSPQALRKLKINSLLIDDVFFETLPDNRKQQLENAAYFEKVFDDSKYNRNWEKIYKIKDEYLKNGGETDGTFEQLTQVIPAEGKVFIDNEENFRPSFLRRPLIFSLRNREIYYLPQSGVYLNVEANINSHPPLDNGNYDYLVLGTYTLPSEICKCQTRLVWKGIKGEVFVWKKND